MIRKVRAGTARRSGTGTFVTRPLKSHHVNMVLQLLGEPDASFTPRTASPWNAAQTLPVSTSSLETVLIETSAKLDTERIEFPSQSIERICARLCRSGERCTVRIHAFLRLPPPRWAFSSLGPCPHQGSFPQKSGCHDHIPASRTTCRTAA